MENKDKELCPYCRRETEDGPLIPEGADETLELILAKEASRFRDLRVDALEEWQERIKRQKFEEKFGPKLEPGRKRVRLFSAQLGAILGGLFFIFLCSMMTFGSPRPVAFLIFLYSGKVDLGSLGHYHFLMLVFMFMGVVVALGNRSESKEEKILWEEFNRQ